MAEQTNAGAVLPRHIGIIMDGNGRWATRRGLPRVAGHKAGVDAFWRVCTYCRDIGIHYVTLYAFSTENWKRPAAEVTILMRLLRGELYKAIETMKKERTRLHFFGDMGPIPKELRDLAHQTDEITEHLPADYFQINICLNYGGRDEILRAVRKFSSDCAAGVRKPEELDEPLFSSYLDTAGIPDPDLIIRSSGELRLSNFLLWQCAYAELYFTDTFWPDFDSAEIDKAIAAYAKRNRRFGGVTQST